MPVMARKPKGQFQVGDEVVLEGVTGRTIEREDGDLVAVHIQGAGIVTLHERWVELVDQSAEYMTHGLEARVRGIVRRVDPAPSRHADEQLLYIAITGTTIIMGISSLRVTHA